MKSSPFCIEALFEVTYFRRGVLKLSTLWMCWICIVEAVPAFLRANLFIRTRDLVRGAVLYLEARKGGIIVLVGKLTNNVAHLLSSFVHCFIAGEMFSFEH